VRASATLRARCAELLARTGWSPQRLAAELRRRELRTACEPVRVLAYRARILLETAPTAQRAAAAAAQAVAPTPRQEHDHAPHAIEPAHEGQTRHATELDALDEQARYKLLEAARARLRRIGLPRNGDFPDDHPLLRGEALNLLRADPLRATDRADRPPASAPQGGESPEAAVDGLVASPAPDDGASGDDRATRRSARRQRSARFHDHRARGSRPTAPAPAEEQGNAPRVASRPRIRDPPAGSSPGDRSNARAAARPQG
jgi:hypothetical protein